MCGIVGYVGPREAAALLVEGLKRLEYRGYDSCGIAILNGGSPQVVRATGRISALEEKISSMSGLPTGPVCGIGHTRWATHGGPNEENAHPHRDCTGEFVVVHNGIIENYLELRRELTVQGHSIRTATDTEVIPHLIEACFEGNLEDAVRKALTRIEGVFAIVAMSSHDSHKIVAARKGPPLVIGLGKGENFVASDAPALLPYTREMIFLNDGEVVVVRRDSVEVSDFSGNLISRDSQQITWSAQMAERQGYPHFMLKEIFEQPSALRATLRGRVDASLLEAELAPIDVFEQAERILIVGCGTSLHAGLVGKFMIEKLARIPVDIDYASEFRYRDPIVGKNTVAIAITQSGETADTLGALRDAREKGAFVISICNVVGSMAARQSDRLLYTPAGPEIGVASTKAFTTQLAVLYLFALFLARIRRTISTPELEHRLTFLRQLPNHAEQVFEQSAKISQLAELISTFSDVLYLGRGINYPIALEGALKLKEISYIHAEGYPAGEMKHGPIALIDSKMPVVVVSPQDSLYRKTFSNIQEARVRDGRIFAVASEADNDISGIAEHVMRIPNTDQFLNPLLAIMPLQLLAYYSAVMRGCDVDKPRNLAKSVTVE
jgi:glucosamine--fructose-6-phosphate aminotransferase (isomerizing)